MASPRRRRPPLFRKGFDTELREQCSAKIRPFVPTASAPLSFDAFLWALESERGRSLRLHPWDNAITGDQMCGAWIRVGRVDHIYYAAHTSETHQRHIVLHEIAHMLWEHDLIRDERALEALFPDLDPLIVRQILLRKRARYGSLEELQAEMTATLIGELINRIPAVASARGTLGRLQETLGGDVSAD